MAATPSRSATASLSSRRARLRESLRTPRPSRRWSGIAWYRTRCCNRCQPSGKPGYVRPAVFLDRDGVLNRSIVRHGKPYPPEAVAEMEILPGVGDALASL